MIITDLAKAKLKEIAEGEGIENLSVRVKTVGGGCSGFFVEMEFDNAPSELDEVLSIDEITVLIDPLSFQYMEGITMDFKEGLMESGFRFFGGDISSSCACGASVSFESKEENNG